VQSTQFKTWEISDNTSKTAQDRDIGPNDSGRLMGYGLSNGTNTSDRE